MDEADFYALWYYNTLKNSPDGSPSPFLNERTKFLTPLMFLPFTMMGLLILASVLL